MGHASDCRREFIGRIEPHALNKAFELAFLDDRWRGGIKTEHRRQKYRIQCAVVQRRIDSAERMAQAVYATQAFLERQGALHRLAHHVQALLPIMGFADCSLNMGPFAAQAVQRYAVWRWIK